MPSFKERVFIFDGVKHLVFSLFVLVVIGCSPVYYAPNAHNVPMFTGKNQTNISGGISFLNSANQGELYTAPAFEVQSAYSFSNHFAAQINFQSVGGSVDSHNYFEGALGYFLPLTKEFVFEVYSGVRYGTVRNSLPDSTEIAIKTNSLKYYVQPSIGFHLKHFFVSLDTRIAYLSFHNIKHNLRQTDLDFFDLNMLNDKYWLIEPCIAFGVNFKHVQLKYQLHFSSSLDGKNLNSYYQGSMISVGFLLNREKDIE